MAHRADWKNYPENSMSAIQSCVDMGVDIVEIDVKVTVDSVVVLSHDDSIDRMTNGSGNISGMTFTKIQKYNMKQGQGGNLETVSKYKMPSLAQVLKQFGNKIMFYIDDGMACRDAVRDLLEEYDCLDTCFFVSDASAEEVSAWFDDLVHQGKELPIFGCKVKSADEDFTVSYLNGFLTNGLSPIAEISFESDDWATAKKETYDRARTGMRVIGTTLGGIQCAGRNDDETGWAYLIGLGCNVIQTDYIQEFVVYQHALNKTHNASKKIQAEHFTYSKGIKVTGADSKLNKILYDFGDGDAVEYNNIFFDSPASTLKIRVWLTGGTLKMLVDGVDAGSVKIYPSVVLSNVEAEIHVLQGLHTICFETKNWSDIMIDSFYFQG